jgi:hypothetical protein
MHTQGGKFPYFVDGFHSRKMAGSLTQLLLDVGNLIVIRGKSDRKDHESLLVGGLSEDLASRESRRLGVCIEPILRESPLIVLSLFRLGAGAENTTNRLRSSCESHRHRIHAVTQTRRGRAIVEHVP